MPVLVLIHIGSHFPEYLNTCISQVQSVSNIPIHLLIEQQHIDKIIASIEVFPLEFIPKSDAHTIFERKTQLDSTFRNGFWKYATQRFFYIYDHVVNKSLDDIFHIEYDNLIYMDFTEYINAFRSKPMWCVMDAPDRCIPSFLYFRNSEILNKMLDTCVQCAANNMHDMAAIAIFTKNNKDIVGTLPIVSNYKEPIDPMYYEHADLFGCLFDGAAIGQFIGGVDPRNISGNTVGFINETTIVKCNKMNIELRNKKPYLNNMPLVNLHIHSKDLDRWKST